MRTGPIVAVIIKIRRASEGHRAQSALWMLAMMASGYVNRSELRRGSERLRLQREAIETLKQARDILRHPKNYVRH